MQWALKKIIAKAVIDGVNIYRTTNMPSYATNYKVVKIQLILGAFDNMSHGSGGLEGDKSSI